MDHDDHVALIRDAVSRPGSSGPPTWADMGAGRGAFTLALADLLGSPSHIIAVDLAARDLAANALEMRGRFPGVQLTTLVADFEGPLDLPPLDGIIAANALHFVRTEHQVRVVTAMMALLRRGAPFVVVEYDADRGNPWVPHPFSSRRWADIATAAGLVDTREIGRVPSRFLGAIYSSVSVRP
jgi:ubiquinone/menaquinone biosynthesis C-methylase UbiE